MAALVFLQGGPRIAASPVVTTLYKGLIDAYGAPLLGPTGAMYGTTFRGGVYGYGEVFELAPPTSPGGTWTFTVLHSFQGHDGAYPATGLVMDKSGALYGMAVKGGASKQDGIVFQLKPPVSPGTTWTERILHNFNSQPGDGSQPVGSMVWGPSGTLYGVTQLGGMFGAGTVFELTPPVKSGSTWGYSILYSFGGHPGDAGACLAGPVMDKNGNLYGASPTGGEASLGTVWELMPPSAPRGAWTEAVLYSFQGQGANGDAAQPWAGVALDVNGVLYGTTFIGGTGSCNSTGLPGCGTVFQLTPPATPGGPWGEAVLYSFQGGSDGAYPEGNVTVGHNGILYSTTYNGGAGDAGTIFRLTPPSVTGGAWTETLLFGFSQPGAGGANPTAGLTSAPLGILFGETFDSVYEIVP